MQVRALSQALHQKRLFGDIAFPDANFDRIFDKTLTTPEQYLGLVVTLGARVVLVNTICVDPEV